MVTGYIPPAEDKKRLIHLSRFHLWDDPYLFKVCADGLLRRCVPLCETRGFLSVVNPRLMEDTTEHSVPMQKFGRVGSSGQTCMETPKNLFGVAQDVKSTGISIPEMLQTTFKWKFLTYGELTSWVPSLCQSIANTSWWLWTT